MKPHPLEQPTLKRVRFLRARGRRHRRKRFFGKRWRRSPIWPQCIWSWRNCGGLGQTTSTGWHGCTASCSHGCMWGSVWKGVSR